MAAVSIRAASEHIAAFKCYREPESTRETVLMDLQLIKRAAALMEDRVIADMRDNRWTWREIAAVLDITPEAARQRWHRNGG